MQSGVIDLGERRLEAAWWGKRHAAAPALVLLHEGLGSVALWRDFPQALAAATGLAVFAYSRLGYGRSDPVPLPRPLTYMHDEARTTLPAVLDAAGISRAVLLGHSDGASIAAIHAGSVPDPRIAGLVLIAPHFFVEESGLASIAAARQDYESGGLRARLARYHDDVEVAFRGWNDAWLDPGFRDFDITGEVAQIAVPMLIIQGADDPYGSAAHMHWAARHAATPVTTLLLPGAQHAPHLEAQAATLTAIGEFLRLLPGFVPDTP